MIRKQLSKSRVVLAAVFLLTAGSAAAEAVSPEATVQEIVAKMKSEGTPAVIVEYVNWPKAYSQFPEKQKEQLEVKSPEEMKAFFKEMLAHPSVVMKKQMEARLSTVPPEKMEEAKQSIAKIEEMMKAKEVEMKDRLTTTVYEIGKSEVKGDQATVKLTQTYKDQKRTEDVTLEKDGDRWMLPSVNMVGKQEEHGAPAGGPPPAPPAAAAEKPKTK